MTGKIPDALEPLWDNISREVLRIHERWIIYRQLFGTSPERIDLLNEIAGLFFHTLEDLMVDDIILSLSRLMDPEKSKTKAGESRNAVLKQFIIHEEITNHPRIGDGFPLHEELLNRYKELEKKCSNLKAIRHKRIAHRDWDVALGIQPLPPISRKSIEDALKELRDFLNAIYGSFKDSEIDFYPVTEADGNALLAALKQSIAYEQAVTEGLIPKRYWMKTSYGNV